jgi:two-component system OmpR family sensor kinase/two-component system sensor histidine kinase BaeS
MTSPENRSPGGAPEGWLDVLLADASGKVVFDTTHRAEGRKLRAAEKGRAVAIAQADDGTVIGYLLLSVPAPSGRLGALEQGFLDRMQKVLLLGGALAVGLGLIVGAVVSRSLAAPLQRLAAAARAVARGHLGQQVRVEGSAEVAEVGRAFNEMTSALEEAETQRQNLVADVAHELRTPLTVLQGNLRAILDGVYALDKSEISRLYDETRLLSRLVDDLRELALADAGQLRLNLRPTDLGQVIGDTLDNLSLVAEAQDVVLSAQLPDTLPTVQADPDRVAQVLRNLLINALRHTPPGGSVTVLACTAGAAMEIAVADTGEGIAREHLPHVFERFWRADPARSRDGRWAGGSGLGLEVAQSLVQAQRGRIWVESEPGKGATFRFTLPLE